MVQQDFAVHKRAKPAGYVYTPTDQMTLQTIQRQIGDLADLTTTAKENLVAAINEVARTGGGAGSMDLRVADGYIQYSTDGGRTWKSLISVAELKGADGSQGPAGAPGKDGAAGAPGKDGAPINWRGAWAETTKYSKLDAVSYDGSSYIFASDIPIIGAIPGIDEAWQLMTQKGNDGADGKPGAAGHTPEKGVDYWTAADKRDIVDDVLAALPTWTGGSY